MTSIRDLAISLERGRIWTLAVVEPCTSLNTSSVLCVPAGQGTGRDARQGAGRDARQDTGRDAGQGAGQGAGRVQGEVHGEVHGEWAARTLRAELAGRVSRLFAPALKEKYDLG